MGPLAGMLIGAVANKMLGGNQAQSGSPTIGSLIADKIQVDQQRKRERRLGQPSVTPPPAAPAPVQLQQTRRNPYASLQPYAASPVAAPYRF